MYFSLFILALFIHSCSTTSQLPEGEQLYTGISEIAYGHKAGTKMGARTDSTGVITAVGKAYETVSDLLRGNVHTQDLQSALKETKGLSPEQRDSLQQASQVFEAATATIKEELNAALAYAPNNAIFGSSKVRWPLPIGLWVYNRYAKSESRFGRWMQNTIGSQPRTISMANPQVRVQVARQTLRNYGFFHGSADYEVQN